MVVSQKFDVLLTVAAIYTAIPYFGRRYLEVYLYVGFVATGLKIERLRIYPAPGEGH